MRKSIYRNAMAEERNGINALVADIVCTTDEDRKQTENTEAVLKSEDLDRRTAEDGNYNALQTRMTWGGVPETAMLFGVMQEEQRIRRDTLICKMSHKRLMHGCMVTLMRRSAALDKWINAGGSKSAEEPI